MSWKLPLKKSNPSALRLSVVNQPSTPNYGAKTSVTPQNYGQAKRFKFSTTATQQSANNSLKGCNDRSLTPRRALQQINKNQGALVTNNFSNLRKELTKKGVRSQL